MTKSKDKSKVDQDEYEIACEAADETNDESVVDNGPVKIGIMTESDKKFMIRVNGKEETACLPSVDSEEAPAPTKKSTPSVLFLKKVSSNVTKAQKKPKCRLSMFKNKNKLPENINSSNNNELTSSALEKKETGDESDGNNNNDDDKVDGQVKYSTLPLVNKHKHKRTIAIPQRTTSDGTQIFYLCDLPKKLRKGFSFFSF